MLFEVMILSNNAIIEVFHNLSATCVAREWQLIAAGDTHGTAVGKMRQMLKRGRPADNWFVIGTTSRTAARKLVKNLKYTPRLKDIGTSEFHGALYSNGQ